MSTPSRNSPPSLVPDEWGGSDLNHPQLSRQDFAASRSNVQLIREIVGQRGGQPDETERLVLDTLRKLADRAPFGHVGNAFLYGATSELLERAQAMPPDRFDDYLRNIDRRQNPLNIFERTPLDTLTEDAKQATLAHVDRSRGQQAFRLFGGMEGQNGPLAFSAGAADAFVEEYGRGARDLLSIAANPLEAGRQFTNAATSLDKLPQAIQQAYGQLQTEIGRWGESDYRKGYLSGQAVIVALDVRDAVESTTRLTQLATEMKAGRVRDLGQAMDILENGRPQRRDPGDGPELDGRQQRPPPTTERPPQVTPGNVSAPDPTLTPSGRQRLPEATQAALIGDAFGFEGALARELNGGIRRWAQGRGENAIENLRNSPDILYGTGRDDIGLIGEAYLRAARLPDSDVPAARRALGDIREAMGGRSAADYGRLYQDLMDPASPSRRFFDDLTANAKRDLHVERVRDASVANAVVFVDGQPRQVFGTARTSDAVHLTTNGESFVAEIRMARTGDGNEYYGWGTNQRWYPFQESDRILNRDGSVNLDRASKAIINDLNSGSAQLDALVPYDRWQERRIEEQRLGSVANAVVFAEGGEPRRVVATAGTGVGIEVVGADRQRLVAEIREARTADGQRYVGFGTNNQWYPFPASVELSRADGSFSMENAQAYIHAQARAGNINRSALVPGDQWDATRRQSGNDGLDQARQPIPGSQQPQRVQEPPRPVDADRQTGAAPPPTQVDGGGSGHPPGQPPRTPPGDGGTPPGDRPGNGGSANGGNDGNGNGNPGNAGRDPADRNEPPRSPLDAPYGLDRATRMREPQPVVLDGVAYEIRGVTDNGELRLAPQGERTRLMPEAQMTIPVQRADGSIEREGRLVTFRDETWRFDSLQVAGWTPGAERSGVRLVDPRDPDRAIVVPTDQMGEVRVRLGGTFGDHTIKQETVYRPDGADLVRLPGREYSLADMRHGVLRLEPVDPQGERLYRPEPGFTFEARDARDPLEGVKTWTVLDNGQLAVEGPNREGVPFRGRGEFSDVAPTAVVVHSPDFQRDYLVDSYFKAEQDARAASRTTPEATGPLRDPALGVSPETAHARLLHGADSLQAQAQFIRDAARDAPPGSNPTLTVFNIGFNNGGEAGRVIEAMRDFRSQHPGAEINVVMYGPSMNTFANSPDFQKLQDDIQAIGINRIDYSNQTQTAAQVIHAKGVAVRFGDAPDAEARALLTTAAVIPRTAEKSDLAIELTGPQARAFNAYVDGAMLGRGDNAFRIDSTAENAANGVLINDPQARLPYISRGYDAVIRSAQDNLFISVSEIRNPDTAQLIADRAAQGVDVRVQYREIDAESLAILQRAQQQHPDRISLENVKQWDPKPHGNVAIADDGRVGIFATAYLWPNQQTNYGHARSLETGVLFQGESAREILREYEALRERQNLRSEQPERDGSQARAPGEATLDPRAAALLADSRSSLEDMNRRVGVNPPPQVTETLAPEVAQRAYAAGFNEVARTDLNLAARQRDGSEIAAGTQLIASDGSERRVVLNIAEALQKTPEQAHAGLVAQVIAANAQPRDPAPTPGVAQEQERQTAGAMRIG